jgi:hypothetical protein
MPNGIKVQAVSCSRLPAIVTKISFKCGIAVFTGSCHKIMSIAVKNIYGDSYAKIYESVGYQNNINPIASEYKQSGSNGKRKTSDFDYKNWSATN